MLHEAGLTADTPHQVSATIYEVQLLVEEHSLELGRVSQEVNPRLDDGQTVYLLSNVGP